MDHKYTLKLWKKRRQEVVALRNKGWTWQEIANELGVTRQRAQQIYQQEAEK